jgi:cytochrome c-type biogenesis protein CcmH/NrfF
MPPSSAVSGDVMVGSLSKLTVPIAIAVLCTVGLVVLIQPRTTGGIALLFLIVTAIVVIVAAGVRELRRKTNPTDKHPTSHNDGDRRQRGSLPFFSRRRHEK